MTAGQLTCIVACLLFLLSFSALQGQESLLEARQRPVGSVVTVKGIVLNGSELGAVRYIQDSTAGIAVYPGGSSPSSFEQVTISDEVQVTGVLSTYHGLLEINPILSYQTLSSNNVLPAPVEKKPDELTFHDQGKLLHITCVRFHHVPGIFDGGNQSFYTEDGYKGIVYLEGNHPLVNTPLPASAVEMTVIASFYDEPRYLVRSMEDINATNCFHILPVPEQTLITETGFQIEWKSNAEAIGFCLLRHPGGDEDTISTQAETEDHLLLLTNLQPAEFYLLQVGALDAGGDTALYSTMWMSTKSTSSGAMFVYFNQNVDVAFSNGASPQGMSFEAMLSSVIDLIENAESTIDIAMYNSNRPDIIEALEDAMDRGVRVRYIGDGGQSNSALDPLPDFPILFRDGDGIMHHKFIVVDPDDALRAKVWTGSTNHSTNQLSWDPNNAMVIQDQALAKAYLHEFEEMWGGSGNAPNPLMSRTGSAKHDDTPHLFQIGDHVVECYFSPSDDTNFEIRTELEAATESIEAALLLLTRNDLTAAMTSRAQEGVDIRVILDDLESSSGPVAALQSNGVLVAHHDYNSIFHHKYAILDEGTLHARVITGSHNWTTSATVRNDENTLIIHDGVIANIYRQEFEARWTEVFPTSDREESNKPHVQVFPNPTDGRIYLNAQEEVDYVHVRDYAGALLFTQSLNTHASLDLSALPSGMYSLVLQMERGDLVRIPVVKY